MLASIIGVRILNELLASAPKSPTSSILLFISTRELFMSQFASCCLLLRLFVSRKQKDPCYIKGSRLRLYLSLCAS